MPRSMSKSASMRRTASSATGEIASADLPLPEVARDVGQFEELAPGMRPAERAPHRRGRAVGPVEVVVAAIGVRRENRPLDGFLILLTLQDAPPAGEVPVGMGLLPVGREEEQRGGRRAPANGRSSRT
jgi:hypothetical protein